MISSFKSLCKYIYETIYESFDNLYSINKTTLEDENMRYCRMQDGNFCIKTDNIEIQSNESEKIKERMEKYRK
jgi:hypothetical protein